MRSKGSIQLQALGTVTEVAQLTGKSVSYISYIMSGRKDPSKAFKEICASIPNGPTVDSWSETVVDPEIRHVTDQDESNAPTDDRVRDMAAQLMRNAETLHAAIEQEASTYEQVRYLDKLTDIIIRLGKLTGASVLNERAIKNTPAFKSLVEIMLKALEPWPDALRAIAKALEESEE